MADQSLGKTSRVDQANRLQVSGKRKRSNWRRSIVAGAGMLAVSLLVFDWYFFFAVVGIGLVLAVAVAGLYFFAQVDAHTIDVAPKIAGTIDKVLIDDNWLVRKGDPIVQIDPRDDDSAD